MTGKDMRKPGEVLLSTEEIAGIVGRLGQEISRDYAGRNPILVNLLKGGVVFLADLIRHLTIPHHIDFLRVSSYEDGTHSSGAVRIVDDLQANIAGRDVLDDLAGVVATAVVDDYDVVDEVRHGAVGMDRGRKLC